MEDGEIKFMGLSFKIGKNFIGKNSKTYFIADIAANHDGSFKRALKLIKLAAQAGANAAKFQHFNANTIVSEVGFESFSAKQSHQAKWGKSVFEVYQDASLDLNWTPALKKACDEAGIAFFSTPYALDLVDAIDQFVPAYKIGSGDITWLEIIEHIAKKNKPYILVELYQSGRNGGRQRASLPKKNDTGHSVNDAGKFQNQFKDSSKI